MAAQEKVAVVVMLFATAILQATASHIPSAEHLCGFIVDSMVESQCLECFQQAGSIDVNPEAVRQCVGTFLPPKMADCSVPQGSNQGHHMNHNHTGHSLPSLRHPGDPEPAARRPGVHRPGVHGHHVTANLLPNCLRRRMKDMSRYLKREQSYTSQAGNILKSILNSNFIPGGGVAMLDIGALRNALANKDIEDLVKSNASSCLATQVERFRDEEFPPEWDIHYQLGKRKKRSTNQTPESEGSVGTSLPFGGRGPIAHDLVVAKCVIDKLIPCCGQRLMEILTSDTFYTPIPHAWFEPLLRYYKDFSASLTSVSS